MLLCFRYTRQTFFYNALNKALRQQKIETLLHMRFFINDVYDQLHALQRVQPQILIRTYRGQLISAEELATFEKSVGQSVLTKSFFSTTADRNLATFVLGDTAQQLERWHVHHIISLKRVLFIIDADPSKANDLIPFADISSKSYFPEEQETLFMAGSIFRILDVRFDENEKIHLITMEFGDIDVKVRELLVHRMKHFGNDNSLITLGHVMQEMGRIDLAETYYHQSLNKMLNRQGFRYDQENIAVCYNSLGNIAQHRHKYEKSLEWYQKALEKYKQVLPANHDLIADSYRCVGGMYARIGNTDRALESLETALTILRTNHDEMHPMIASCLHGIGTTYLQSTNIHDISNIALESLQKALNIRQQVHPDNDPSISTTMHSIGSLYRALGQFDEALTWYERSLEVKLKSMPKSHPTVIANYHMLNTVCQEKGDYEKASKYAELMSHCEAQLHVLNQPDCIEIQIQSFKGSSDDSST
jgi:tetratricopeptide (TPR) repeat protein